MSTFCYPFYEIFTKCVSLYAHHVGELSRGSEQLNDLPKATLVLQSEVQGWALPTVAGAWGPLFKPEQTTQWTLDSPDWGWSHLNFLALSCSHLDCLRAGICIFFYYYLGNSLRLPKKLQE